MAIPRGCESSIKCRTQNLGPRLIRTRFYAPDGARYILADSQVSPNNIDIMSDVVWIIVPDGACYILAGS